MFCDVVSLRLAAYLDLILRTFKRVLDWVKKGDPESEMYHEGQTIKSFNCTRRILDVTVMHCTPVNNIRGFL